MSAPLATWTEHVIVCGLHDEGLRVVEQLDTAGVSVIVVDDAPDVRLLPALARLGVPHHPGDSRQQETLEAVGLAGALALVCVESHDLHTLATALLARELRPDARIVVQLRNASVGRALEDIGVAVLDVAGLSAPAITDACLRTGLQRLVLGSAELVVAEVVNVATGTLRETYGDLAPIAVIPAGGAHVVIAPGRDESVAPGDTVVVVGTAEEIASAGLAGPAARAPATPVFLGARAPRTSRPHRSALVLDVVRGIDRRLKLALGALAVLAATSVAVLMIGYQEADGRRMSGLDALYFTVETIGTVGFGDFYFRDQAPWLRFWAITLMLVGATLATVFFALLTNTLISRTIERTLGNRKVTGLSDHIIVVGLGSIGLAVAGELQAAGIPVVVVESDESNRYLAHVRDRKVPVVIADATQAETLSSVRLDRARAVAVMTSDDLANIETGLAVRDLLDTRWADVPVVLRLFDQRLAQTVESSFDFRYVRSPAALAAPWFVGAALGLEVLSTFYVGDLPLLVARLDVRAGSGLDGLAMRDLSAQIRVVSLEHAGGTTEHTPRRDSRFAAGDTAFMIGPYDEMLRLLRTYPVYSGSTLRRRR